MKFWSLFLALLICTFASAARGQDAALTDAGARWDAWVESVDKAVIDAYGASDGKSANLPSAPDVSKVWKSESAKSLLRSVTGQPTTRPASETAGVIRARAQQALILEMSDAVKAGDVARAQAWRARLVKPRGVSSAAGALVLQVLSKSNQRDDASRELVREAITWQTTRARQLLDEASRSTQKPVAMPGRLAERFAEAIALADLPAPLSAAAGIPDAAATANWDSQLVSVTSQNWEQLSAPTEALRRSIESALPSLLTADEKSRREKLLLKLVNLIPKEYSAGVRNGEVAVPLEYRESVSFTAQARQFVGELAPLWLAGDSTRREIVEKLDASLAEADSLIGRKASAKEVETALDSARATLEGPLQITLKRSGSTAEIVEEVLLETRSLLNSSLARALEGNWAEAEQLRLEAYTTFDPDLEARLAPRDPQLALDIEHLLVIGLDKPGVKVLLDQRAPAEELEAAYARVIEAMDKAGVLLKSGIDPTAAAINAGSIVMREGLEGLLVIVAILAGLRGKENRGRRNLVWTGILASAVVTGITYILSQTLLGRLNAYMEIIEAVTALLAIGVLLLITNWLFHQIYWNQWVTSLKAQCEGESKWQLVSVGFLIGYREGFETVLFLQSLVLDAGGKPVAIGVAIGLAILISCGIAALGMGLRLPYFKMLMLTALLIGIVLVTFVGNGVRVMQTVGWLPVHRIFAGSLPAWVGQWLGIYNTWESVISQMLIACVVLGTWRISRWRAKRAGAARRAAKEDERREGATRPTVPSSDHSADHASESAVQIA